MDNQIRRALIVEDAPMMRDLVKAVLGGFGVQDIALAANGVEAIDVLKSGGADIVFMDRKMDVMDGLECTRRIRDGIEGINPRTPIILMTGMSGDASEKAAYAAGVDHFLEKPISMVQLHAGVVKVLGAANTP